MKARVCKSRDGFYIVQTKKFGLIWLTMCDMDYFPTLQWFSTYEEAEEALSKFEPFFKSVFGTPFKAIKQLFGIGFKCYNETKI